MKRLVRSRYAYVALALLVGLILLLSLRGGSGPKSISLSRFESDLAAPGRVVSATVHDGTDEITGKLSNGSSFSVSYPNRLTESLTTKMLSAGTEVSVSHATSNFWLNFLNGWVPLLVFGGLLLYVLPTALEKLAPTPDRLSLAEEG